MKADSLPWRGIVLLVALFAARSGLQAAEGRSLAGRDRPKPRWASVNVLRSVSPYEDIRWKDVANVRGLDASKILRLTFNDSTKWSAADLATARETLAQGMNPGLGVRSLHQAGITGAGVSVGIVDQNIYLDYPGFRERVAKYKDVGCHQSYGSMHGPAVASLLVGKSNGTAPGAKLYFAAAPSWTGDAQYQADGLNWLLDVNEKLPAVEKIRVVSVSASPSGPTSPFTKNKPAWDAAYDRAVKAGVLVLDCTSHHGIIGPCYYDPVAPDDLARVTPGFPGQRPGELRNRILAPCSHRTVAEEYIKGVYGYQYTGRGGLSWSIPYAAGVFALGWQVNPQLTPERAVELLRQTAYQKDGHLIIDPVAFVKAVKGTVVAAQ